MKNPNESWSRLEEIFHAVASAPAEHREKVLEAECAGDESLRAEVRSLLTAAAAEERLSTTRRQAARAREHAQQDVNGLESRRRIGPYQIDRLIGRGGMGAVYLAHRADGEFDQQVAIKLIDLPLATNLFRERFRMERQILAGLVHPYIARLLDGGVTEEGDPYLVMEFANGIPISVYCRQHKLPLRDRLALFMNVCEAVQFAHQNLVVHRDLKPDNILIVADGTPRLLDFGTAKILSPGTPQEGQDLTRQGFHSYTPQFASPEQILGQAITTATDNYSLGVLLYLLITDSAPYQLCEFTVEEMIRIVCNQEPQRPSIAPTQPFKLDADLDAIVLKALRKEPRDRYRSTDQFSADIQAYLEGRAVAARAGTLRYRAGKFVRRNRMALAGAALLIGVFVAGVAGIAWQAHLVAVQSRMTQARSADLTILSNSLLTELDEAIKQLPGSTGAQQLLVSRVLEHLDRMAKDSNGDRLGQLNLIDAYTRLGNISGNGYEQNLGNRNEALASIGKAVALAKPLVAASPDDRDALRALAVAEKSRGEILSETEDLQGALTSLQTAAKTYDHLIALPDAKPALLLDASGVNDTLGDLVGQDTGFADVPAALVAYRHSLDLDARALALDPGSLPAKRALAHERMKLGNAELDNDPFQALKDFRLALQLTEALPASDQATVNTTRLRAITLRKIGSALSELGDYAQAETFIEQSLQIHQKLADADPKDVRNLGDVKRALQAQAMNYSYAVDPVLAAPSVDPAQSRTSNLRALQAVLEQYQANLDRTLKLTPQDADREAERANVHVRLNAVNQLLHPSVAADPSSKAALALLHNAAASPTASTMTLGMVFTAIASEKARSLRDPGAELETAKRGVDLTHGKAPDWLLDLAEAYRDEGEIDQSRAAANQGLSLVPQPAAGEPKSRIRKLLELNAGELNAGAVNLPQ